MQRHAVAPDGSPALDDHKRAAGDVRQRGQRLGEVCKISIVDSLMQSTIWSLISREPLLSTYASISQYLDQQVQSDHITMVRIRNNDCVNSPDHILMLLALKWSYCP